MSIMTQGLQLTPYAAIAFAVLLGTTIGVICYGRRNRDVGSGGSWRVSISSIFKRWRPLLRGRWSSPPAVIVHDPSSSQPHDLDDPFFDARVQELVGATIAKAARKR
jgi:hypothetical protein